MQSWVLRIRQRLAAWLRSVAERLDPTPAVVVSEEDVRLATAAALAVQHAQEQPHTSSYRRAIAMRFLIERRAQFPNRGKLEYSEAIDKAVRKMREDAVS